MASQLSFTPITDFSLPSEKFPKSPQRIPIFSHLPLNSCSGYHCFKNISSSIRLSVCHAVKEQEVIQSINSDSTQNSPPASSKFVLVVGGTGGVGQLVVASLLTRNIRSRLLLRDPEKATTLFGKQDEEKLNVWKGDTRNPGDLDPSIFEGITHVICCTGTTAFPSRRWDGDNTPERVDWEGVRNLVSSLPSSLKRIVLVSSVGVTKFNELPWRKTSELIYFHVEGMDDPWYERGMSKFSLKEICENNKWKAVIERILERRKKEERLQRKNRDHLRGYQCHEPFWCSQVQEDGEDFVRNSGLPFTIIRPGRLTDGPYTSYDLNTLLKATAGERRAVVVGQGDKLVGEVSRLVVAEACIQALDIEFTEGEVYEINSVQGEGPGSDPQKWRELFKAAQVQ